MATKPLTQNFESFSKTVTAIWEDLAKNDEGEVLTLLGNKTSVQAIGTFSGSTITMEGSNDGVNWSNLNDEAVPGNVCSFTAAGFKGVLQTVKYIRPKVTGGTATSLKVVLINR